MNKYSKYFLSMVVIPFVNIYSEAAEVIVNHNKRPNILWLTYEDTSPQFIGCYGNDYAVTPVMDSLAKDGILFTNAFSTGTVSSPSRFCLITGCRTTKYGTGNHRSAYEIPDFVHGFPEYLRKAGYYTSNNWKTDYNHKYQRKMIRASWDECSKKATWRNRKPGQPFFAVFNMFDSHQSRTMTNPWNVYKKEVLDVLDPKRKVDEEANFEMPLFYKDTPRMRKEVSRVYNSISLADQKFGQILKQLDEDGLRDSTIIFCYADHGEGIPRGKGSSIALGYKVPFSMWIPKMYENLVPWGRGVKSNELVSFEDFGATVLSLAGVKVPSYIEGKPFLPAKKEHKKKYVFGADDVVDFNVETSRSVTDGNYIYTRVFTPYQPFVRWICYYDFSEIQTYMRQDFNNGIMNKTQSRIMKPRSAEYLYNIKDDRWEIHNLAYNPKYKDRVERMRNALKEHLIEMKDANFIPEYSLMYNTQHLIPYYLRQDKKFFPVKKVMETAWLTGMGKSVIPQQIEALKSKNPIVSYWAAIGLFTQKQNLKPYLSEIVKILPYLSYAPARIWTAASVLNIKNNNVARNILNDYILCSNKYLFNYAANVLSELPLPVAKSFLPIINKYPYTTHSYYSTFSMMSILRLRLEGIPINYNNFW